MVGYLIQMVICFELVVFSEKLGADDIRKWLSTEVTSFKYYDLPACSTLQLPTSLTVSSSLRAVQTRWGSDEPLCRHSATRARASCGVSVCHCPT